MTGVDLHLQDTIGCTFIGILFSTILHGLTLAQTTFYFTRYSADAISLKALVVILLILDTAKEMIIVQLLWNYLVESHGVPEALAVLPSTYGAQHVLAAVAVLLVQCFYLKNIWHISPGNKCRTLLAALRTLLALVSFGAGMGLVWGMYQTRFFKQALALVTRAGFTQLGSALITDIYIASSLIVILHGSRTGFRPTDTLLSKLILYAVDRGILLCTVQIVQLVTYVHDYKNGTVTTEIAYFPQSTLYVNTVLVALNARDHLRQIQTRTTHSFLTTFAVLPVEPMQEVATRSPLGPMRGAMDSNEIPNAYGMQHHVALNIPDSD